MSIDWSKPLGLTDGTPVRLEESDVREHPAYTNGADGAPDSQGDYWIVREDGLPFCAGLFSLCVCPDEGSSGFDDVPPVRNRG